MHRTLGKKQLRQIVEPADRTLDQLELDLVDRCAGLSGDDLARRLGRRIVQERVVQERVGGDGSAGRPRVGAGRDRQGQTSEKGLR